MTRLLNEKTATDCKIIVGTGANEQVFFAHKILLYRSDVMRKRLMDKSRENSNNVVHLEDVKPEMVRKLLTFLYTNGYGILPALEFARYGGR